MDDTKKYIGSNEAAEILGVERQQVVRYVRRGILKSVQYGARTRHRFSRTDVLAMKNGKTS